MKAITLLLTRISTGLLLVIWGLIKVKAPEKAAGVSDKYYNGLISADTLQMPLGTLQILLGLVVILGVFRKVAYPIQAIVLGFGVAAIWQYILDPLGLYLLTPETSKLLFFPSTTVFFASLALMAFKEYDTLSIDGMRGK